MKILKYIKFFLKCVGLVWNDRKTKASRNKWRRLSREFEKINQKLELN